MSDSIVKKEAYFRKLIVALTYISIILMFLSGAFRRLSPAIKIYHVAVGPGIVIALILFHLWSVRKLIKAAFVSKMQAPGTRFRYGIILCMLITLVLMIITAYLRKRHIIIRDFHTIYLPIFLTSLIIMHIFSVLRRKTASGEVHTRKDYKWLAGFGITILILSLITAVSVIILQKIDIL